MRSPGLGPLEPLTRQVTSQFEAGVRRPSEEAISDQRRHSTGILPISGSLLHQVRGCSSRISLGSPSNSLAGPFTALIVRS
jgi:hypothetical protein